MSFLDSLKDLFGRKPTLPSAPKPKADLPRIYLRADQLNWRNMDEVKRFFGSRAAIKGKTVDLRGAVLNGKNLARSSNGQDENALGVQVRIQGFVLRNGWVEDVPGGIVVKESYCSFEKLRFIKIGEDALSTVGEEADGIKISGCEFWNGGGDKSIQLNQAFAAIVQDCRIIGGITGIRVQKQSYKTNGVNCIIRGCDFEGCETGFNVSGKAIVRLQSPIFRSVKKKWVTGPDAKVIET